MKTKADPSVLEEAGVGRGRRTVCLVLAASLVVLHFLMLDAHFEPAISTPDASGYFAQARHIAESGRTYFTAESPVQFIPTHWLATGDDRYFSKYPPGLPIIAAVAYRLFGPAAALRVDLVMASLSLLAVFLICRLWIGDGWALLAAALMAVNPPANQQALWAFAHTAVAFFLVWGMYAAARWARTHSAGWAFGAGLCFGVIPTVRYAEVLFCLALVVFVAVNLRRQRGIARSVAAGAIGVALPLGALAIRNQLAFGGFARTGYSMTNEQAGFGWSYFAEHFLPYIQQTLAEGAGFAMGLGVVGLAVLCASRATWRRGVFLSLLVLPSTLLYMAYYWAPDGASMRFLVPTLFVYPIAAVWMLQMLTSRSRPAAVSAAVVLLLVTIAWGLPASLRAMHREAENNASLSIVTRAVTQHVDPDSIVIADGQIQQQLDYVGGWRLADESILTHGNRRPPRRMQEEGEDAPRPTQIGRAERLKRYKGLQGMERFDAFAEDVQDWAGTERKVYWIVTEDRRDRLMENLYDDESLVTIAKIELPDRQAIGPDQRRRHRGPGRRGGGGPGPGRGPGGGPGPGRLGGTQQDTLLLLTEWRANRLTSRILAD